MREGEKSNERNATEQWSDQLIDFDQRDQKTRSDKNQRCAKRGGNTKTELQVVRFPEQTGTSSTWSDSQLRSLRV